ncbi:6146_t:CDS:2 [Funneliformis geosporum]|uniref:9234_t:CDS:1 n=1 Tax=Funneliformis geosporum TaxID=1117311 RepID=A0A9W4SPD0_9GLOM|nr:9234_t:CDS:2 [Funneliformis geosporum]CAI2180650.1 6146_t:CDS:2 [Funneliformis geosporum]
MITAIRCVVKSVCLKKKKIGRSCCRIGGYKCGTDGWSVLIRMFAASASSGQQLVLQDSRARATISRNLIFIVPIIKIFSSPIYIEEKSRQNLDRRDLMKRSKNTRRHE